jgi:1,4-dihydroxy-2-naphthoyl-CoA hydrolase
MIWKEKFEVENANIFSKNTLVEHLGIEFVELGDDYLVARMPVDHRTVQPFKLLHGGASVALAETVGSFASNLVVDTSKFGVVGVEINANHLKGVKSGFVYGKAKPIRLGRNLHIWSIEITDEDKNLVCVSRLTTMIIPHSK